MGKNKYPPISVRLPEEDRAWLLEHARATGQPVNRIVRAALGLFRKRIEHEEAS